MKRLLMLLSVALVLGGGAGMVLAADTAPDEDANAGPVAKTQADIPMAKAIAITGICLGAGLAAVGGAMGIASVGGRGVDAIARQPEVAGAVFTPLILTAAMIEGGMLFAMFVCLMGLWSI